MKRGSTMTQKKFYEEKWFWYAVLAMVSIICLTRRNKIIVKGVGNGNANGSNFNSTTNNP